MININVKPLFRVSKVYDIHTRTYNNVEVHLCNLNMLKVLTLILTKN